MDFRQKITLHFLIYITLCSVAFAQVVEIPDPNLRDAVREALNIAGRDVPLTQPLLRTRLTRLDAPDRGIADLTGLEFAGKLTWLSIVGNPITDFSPIAGLTNLETLYMWWTPISDISPLANLTNLRSLNAAGCDIVDISPLANLTQLEYVNLRHNKIADIQPLAGLTLLRHLQLNSNQISDVNSLAKLSHLEVLEIQNNRIADHSPLDTLSLTHFVYDQSCEVPPLPLQPRLENRTFPSVFAAWGGIGWSPVLNQPHLSDLEQMSQHDLYFCCLMFGQHFFNTGVSWEVRGDLGGAEQLRDDYIALNPNMIFLAGIEFRAALLSEYPENWPYWLRDAQGNIVDAGQSDGFIDFTHPGFQDRMVAQAVAISKCGLYDGVMIDWWNDKGPLLVTYNPHKKYRGHEVEMQAKINILERIRAETRSDFLIIGNVNQDKLPRTGQYINGGFMETGVPADHGPEGDEGLRKIESTLLWAEQNMRQPRINALEGWGFPGEPPASPANLRWMRVFTTLSLTHSDCYVLFNVGDGGHTHYWYGFWDADLGHPVGAKTQLYDNRDGLYMREYTNGWAVYNHSGEAQIITLPEEVQGVASGVVNSEHPLPNLDGEMYLRVKPKNPADVNGDGVVNIFDLTIVAQGFGTDKPEADVNGDGVVNVFDLVFVANQF